VAPKKLHSLLVKSFLPPFFITLFVGVFLFFLVEIVITYLDELLGKGLGFWTLCELFFYAWVSIIPQCIPLAVLLASIMSMGSLAENYELAAMKSAGLSLFRILRPLVFTVFCLGAMTFVFNNYILPKVMLKFQTLLYDVRQAKPAMNIKEGIFYNKINGDNYSMRVGKKGKDGQTLKDVIIYDHSDHLGNNRQLYADSGTMRMTSDTNYLTIKLFDGNRYEEMTPEAGHALSKPMTQLNFKELEVNIELTDFKLKRTQEGAFRNYSEMMNVWQIDQELDTVNKILDGRYKSLQDQSRNYFFFRSINFIKQPHKEYVNTRKFYGSLPIADFNKAVDNALNIARSSSAYVDSVIEGTKIERDKQDDFKIGWHEKINVCFACLVLFFVGAPLGAIIRKGGMGLPVVVAVIFFLAFFIFTEAFRQLAVDDVVEPWIGMWMPLILFLPIGFFLTFKAAKDSALFDMDAYLAPFKRIFSLRKKNKTVVE
jgi:lipopolysaccharide export system permease protein